MDVAVAKAYESGVLLPEVHNRLVQDIDRIARKANIPESMVLMKMSSFGCSEEEIAYVRKLKAMSAQGVYGLIYKGKEGKYSVLSRMMAVAGACLRNFVDARVMTLQDVFQATKDNAMPEPTVLLIPNFYASKSEGGHVPDWHLANLLGLLYSRQSKGLQTFLYVSDLKAMRSDYGDLITMHLSKNFKTVSA